MLFTIALGESGDRSPASMARPAFMLIERDMASTMPPATTRARRTSSVRSHPLTCSNRIAHSAEYSLRYGEESGTAGVLTSGDVDLGMPTVLSRSL